MIFVTFFWWKFKLWEIQLLMVNISKNAGEHLKLCSNPNFRWLKLHFSLVRSPLSHVWCWSLHAPHDVATSCVEEGASWAGLAPSLGVYDLWIVFTIFYFRKNDGFIWIICNDVHIILEDLGSKLLVLHILRDHDFRILVWHHQTVSRPCHEKNSIPSRLKPRIACHPRSGSNVSMLSRINWHSENKQ
jgi:hypothetical protein